MILTTLETQATQLDEIDSLGIEIFWAEFGELSADPIGNDGSADPLPAGWYWWNCFPGCLPDSVPFGPFATSHEAKKDAGLR